MVKMTKNPHVQLTQLENEYRTTSSIATSFCKELSNQIYKLFDNEQVSLGFPIEYRVKTWESIVDKLERVSLTLTSIKDLNDLAGLRIILLFKRDLIKVCELLRNNFKVINQYDTQERLKEDQFGYASVHFIIELPDSWLLVPTFSQMRGFKAEIQVRTVAQHIWAAASHYLQYKKEESVPPPIRRALYRVSALLETVDLEFERVIKEREIYRSDIDILESEEHLNVDLLEKTLDSLLPEKNKRGTEDYSDFLSELMYFRIDTVPKLKDLIEKHRNAALESDAEWVQRLREWEAEDLAQSEISPERIAQGVYFTHTGLARHALGEEFGQAYEQYLQNE